MVALAFMISCFNAFALRTSLAMFCACERYLGMGGYTSGSHPSRDGADGGGASADEAAAQGGVVFRISGQGDSFDVVMQLAAALLGLGQRAWRNFAEWLRRTLLSSSPQRLAHEVRWSKTCLGV